MTTIPITTNSSSGIAHIGLVGAQPTWHLINRSGRFVELEGTWEDDLKTIAFISGLALRRAGVGTDVILGGGWSTTTDDHRDGVTAFKHVGFGPRT